MPKLRPQTWIALILIPAGILLVALPALWMFMRTTATTLHPDAQNIPSLRQTEPPSSWREASDNARRAVMRHLASKNLPGLSAAVGVDESVVWAEGFGFADLEQQLPVLPTHRFRIGTASALLTSAAAGLLIEQGQLKLDEPVQTYVPGFDSKRWPITLRQLMSHVSGLRNDGGDESPLFSQHCARPIEAIPAFASRDLLFEPGTKFHYSSYGWILVSAAIESASRTPFLEYMQRQVFDPLELHDTAAEGNQPGDRVTSYFPRFAADPAYGLHLMREIDQSCYSGAGVFLSTPSDLVRFVLSVQRGKLLRPATVQQLQTPWKPGTDGFGLGWEIRTVNLGGKTIRTAGHDGKVLGGPVASILSVPDQGLAVAVISNIPYADPFPLAVEIAEAFAAARKPH